MGDTRVDITLRNISDENLFKKVIFLIKIFA